MNELQLTNKALRLAKVATIESLDDTGDIPAWAREQLPLTIEEFLLEKDWGFARIRKPLNLLPDLEYSEWSYVYDLPDDMVQLQKLAIPGTDHRLSHLDDRDFEVFNNNDTADQALMRVASDQSELDAVYTARITNVSYLPFWFSSALAYLLAYYASLEFGSSEKANENMNLFHGKYRVDAFAADNKTQRPNRHGHWPLLDNEAPDSRNVRTGWPVRIRR